MTATTIFDRMRRDHKNVLERVAALERNVLRAARGRTHEKDIKDLVAMLERQFATHMTGEDQVIYPELLPVLPQGGAALEPLRAEHEELRAMLARLRATIRRRPGPARNEEVAVQVRDLIDLLRIHIRKEEIVLGVAERVLTPHEIGALETRLAALFRTPTSGGST